MAYGDRSLSGQISVVISGRYNLTAEINDVPDNFVASFSKAFTSGTAADTADRLFKKSSSVTAGAALDLDLKGALLDVFGVAFTPAELCMIYAKNTSASNNLLLGGDANGVPGIFGALNDIIAVPPGGCFFLCNFNDPAWVVTAGTGDIIQIDASSGTVNYDLMLVGRSA